jgi:type II secretory ATPase GspE/PulE/Tfp pilus assembly ATPase PilB-like protein
MPGELLELLAARGALTAEQADLARRRSRRAGVPEHQAVLDLGFASEETVYRALAEFHLLEFDGLASFRIPDELLKKVPAKLAFHYRFVPIAMDRTTLRAAFATPPSVRDRENLRLLLGLRLDPVIATPATILRTLKLGYGLGAETVLQIRQDRAGERRGPTVTYEDAAGQDLTAAAADAETASIISLVNQILVEALELGTTDIHLEPYPGGVKLRYRIDGMLREVPTPPGMKELHEAIVTRLKVMANLNIAERRLPHDGRIRVRINEENFDLRVSILPTRFGETVCLRILNRESIFLEMEQLGLTKQQLAILNHLVGLPHGMILVTGPTGSGKTTTLYAALAKVKSRSPERKVITVEDPVEYELEGLTQIQIRAEIGLTFAAGLRSILRHDPDIILVGEIRDGETAEIAIRSALTGHLVFSTLHTNDAVGAVNRLVDMGIEPYLVASSMVASLAQRLVRRICPHCKEEEALKPHLRQEMARSLGLAEGEVRAWRGRGCVECNQLGYRGRVAILEVFLLDEAVQDMVSRHASTMELREAARQRGMRSLRDAGWEKVAQGLTTVEEVARITSNFQLAYDAQEEPPSA